MKGEYDEADTPQRLTNAPDDALRLRDARLITDKLKKKGKMTTNTHQKTMELHLEQDTREKSSH